MLIFIGLCAFLSVSLVAVGAARELSAPRARLRERVATIARGEHAGAPDFRGRRLLRMQSYSSLPVLRDLLQRSARAERLADDLERAAIPLRVGEYLLIRVGVGLVLALLVGRSFEADTTRVIMMALMLLVGMLIPRWFVLLRIRRRRTQIENQLPDGLDMIARTLRTGGGLVGAIDSVVEQMGGALGDELGRTRQEMAAGLGMEDAFQALDRRVKSKDLHIIVTALLVQREVGGNLAEILDNVAGAMRERIRMRQEMEAMVSRQRLSAYMIASVPVIVLVALAVFAGDVTKPLFERDGGRILLGVAGLLEIVGFLTMHRLASSFEV